MSEKEGQDSINQARGHVYPPIDILPVPGPDSVLVGDQKTLETVIEKAATSSPSDLKVPVEQDEVELEHLSPEEKAIILSQTETNRKLKNANFFDLFRFATRFELFLNAIGLVCAIATGIAEVIFGRVYSLH
jgi:hypothetical protein